MRSQHRKGEADTDDRGSRGKDKCQDSGKDRGRDRAICAAMP